MASITRQITQEGIKIVTRTVTRKFIDDHAKEQIRKELDKMPGTEAPLEVIVIASKEEVKRGIIPAGTPVVLANTQETSHPWPTTEETVDVVKEDLLNQIDQIEFDLMRGGRIAGKSCDCFQKHSRKIKALGKELISIQHDPAYSGLVDWVESHKGEFSPEAIEQHDVEYYRSLIPALRTFRKKIEGTA